MLLKTSCQMSLYPRLSRRRIFSAASPRPARRRRCCGSRCSGTDCRKSRSVSRASVGSGLSRSSSKRRRDSRRAEAALQAVMVAERLLQRMQRGLSCAMPSTVVTRDRRLAPRAEAGARRIGRRTGWCRRRTRRARSRDACRSAAARCRRKSASVTRTGTVASRRAPLTVTAMARVSLTMAFPRRCVHAP